MFQPDMFDFQQVASVDVVLDEVRPSPADDQPPTPAGPPTPNEIASKATPPPANFEELRSWLQREMEPTRRTMDMRAALRSVAKVLGRPLSGVPTDPAILSPLLAAAAPAVMNMTPARWSRVKSLTRSALGAAGVGVLPGRDTQILSPAWDMLLRSVPDKGVRIGVSRLVHHLSRAGLGPADVAERHLFAFGSDLRTGSLHDNPEQAYRSSVRKWNSAVDLMPAWPQIRVELAPDPRRYSLSLDQFPASFQADLASFLTNSEKPDVFSEHYFEPARPATIKARKGQVQRLASALVASGTPLAEVATLAVLAQPDNARAALRYLFNRRGGKTGSDLSSLARLLQTIARHWVRDTAMADAIKRTTTALHPKQTGMVAKNRQLLRQFDLPENKAALLNLPAKVFREAKASPKTVETATRVLMAMAVEVELMAPMRALNLTQIEVGRHLLEVRRGSAKRYHVVFTPEETKTREPYEMELPQASGALLDTYLRVYRPLLPGAETAFLFPGRLGMRSSVAFGQAIKNFVARETGLRMHLHLFRQVAGKLYLDQQPDDLETLRQVLGHRSSNTTMRSYAELRRDRAFRRFDAVVEAHRAQSQPQASIRPKQPRRASGKKGN